MENLPLNQLTKEELLRLASLQLAIKANETQSPLGEPKSVTEIAEEIYAFLKVEP